MVVTIKFPALVIRSTYIDKINYRFFVGNKRFIKTGYKNVTIIDSNCYCLLVNGTRQIGGVSIIDSLRNFDWLVRMEPILKEPPRKISLDEVKKIIINIIETHSRNFSNLDSRDSLIDAIKKSTNICEIIKVF